MKDYAYLCVNCFTLRCNKETLIVCKELRMIAHKQYTIFCTTMLLSFLFFNFLSRQKGEKEKRERTVQKVSLWYCCYQGVSRLFYCMFLKGFHSAFHWNINHFWVRVYSKITLDELEVKYTSLGKNQEICDFNIFKFTFLALLIKWINKSL